MKTETTTKDLITGIILITAVALVLLWATGYLNNIVALSHSSDEPVEVVNNIPSWVRIYNISGELIKEYDGIISIDYSKDIITLTDEHGLHHTIYGPSTTVIIDEVGG